MALETFKNAPNLTTPEVAWTTLNGAINAAVTSVTVASAAAFPASGQFRIAIESELLIVTGVAGAVFTVTRGAESTTAASHSSGTSVFHILTAASLLRCPRSMTTTGDLEYLDSSGAPTRWAAAADGSSLTYGGDTTLARGDTTGQMTLSGSSTGNSFRVKNGSNAELGAISWDGSNNFRVGTQGGVGVGTPRVTLISSAAELYFAAGGTTRWTIDETDGYLRPFADATYDIGTALLKVRAAYVNKLGTLTTNGFVKTSGGDGTLSVDTASYGVTTGTLAQFAATTSAELAGVISNETGSGALMFGTSPTITTSLIFADAANIVTNASTGTIIGTATSQKLSLWAAAPIAQPTTGIAAATFTANTSLIANDTATWDGYTIGQAIKALRNFGLLA